MSERREHWGTEELRHGIRTHPGIAFSMLAWIRDKQGVERHVMDRTLRPDGRPLYPGVNVLQWRLFEIYKWCHEQGMPCRIVGLKPRKTGLSTAVQWLIYWLHRTRLLESATAGDTFNTSGDIQRITGTFIRHDRFPWEQYGGSGVQARPDGSSRWNYTNGGISSIETARDPSLLRGSTPQAQHRSEVAHFFKSGAFNAAKVLLGANQSTADMPGTVIIDESTPNGAAGYFYDQYQAAVPFEDAKLGRFPPKWSGWIRLVAFWYEFEEYVDWGATDEELDRLEKELTPHEQMLCDVKGCTLAQISWRRKKIDSMKASGGERFFLQEYVEDERSCFIASGRPYFDIGAIDRIMALSRRDRYIGTLSLQPNGIISFTPHSAGRITIWEYPVKGREYIAIADTMTGEEQVDDTGIADRHSCLIFRGPYQSRAGIWHNAALVARVTPPFQDATMPAIDLFERLVQFYGSCLIVIEFNFTGSAWCLELGRRNASLFCREKFDEVTRRTLKKVGWLTDKESREVALSSFAKMVTPSTVDGDCTLDIFDENVAGEMQTFSYDKSGKPCAISGQHDDDVMACAIGAYCMPYATRYFGQRSIEPDEDDLLT